jgi:copper/silver efflux system protein
MIDRLIELSLRNRFLVVALWIGIAGWGLWAMLRAPIDAIPDLSDNQVIVFTDWSGRSPQEVEDQITYPLTVNLQGLPGVKVVRSSSAFGFSMIFVIFEDNVDLYFARTRVLERLNLVSKQLPPGVVPTLGPDATGVGHVFWYTVEGGGLSLRDLRSLQDWYVRYQLNSVPGVAEVASVGGTVQQYQIDIDPNRLRSYALPLSTVVRAVMASNSNVGGNVVSQNGSWSIVRGLGLIGNLDDIRNIVIASHNGTPVFVKDLGTVQIGDAFRTAALVKNSSEAVGGVIVARTGENTKDVIDRVKEKIRQIEPGLPPGVHIVSFYDRSELIEATVGTLRHALIEEIILVTLAHVIFLMHFRSILIVTLPLPLAVLCSFLLMHYANVTSNVMSLAGIAIAIGVLVDAGIVVTENAFRHLEGVDARPRKSSGDRAARNETGRTANVFLYGDHRSRFRSCVRADRTGRQALSSPSVCKNLCDGERNGHRTYPDTHPLHATFAREVSFGGSESGDALPSAPLSPCALVGAGSPAHHARTRPRILSWRGVAGFDYRK